MSKRPATLIKQGAIEQLRQDLVRQIQNGELAPNMPILSAMALSNLYKVSYPTVHRVLTELVQEGLIVRTQGKGSFVAPKPVVDNHGNAAVGIFMRATGDLFGPMFSHVSNHLQEAGLLCVASDPATKTFKQAPETCIRDVLESKPIALIAEGIASLPFAAFKKHEQDIPHLVFIHLLQTRLSFNADAILSDFERGGYLAARHLIERGHRHLTIQIYGPPESTQIEWQHARDRLRGCLLACSEGGIPEENVDILDLNAGATSLSERLRSPNPPTAVIAASDYEASRVFTEARALNLRIPEDLSLIGYFNTSWCNRLEVPLTSVSIREDVIARRTVDAVREKRANPDSPRARILLDPELVLRGSTAPPPTRKR